MERSVWRCHKIYNMRELSKNKKIKKNLRVLFFNFRAYWKKFPRISYETCNVGNDVSVRYHTGGSMKLNARTLHLAYMVYL